MSPKSTRIAVIVAAAVVALVAGAWLWLGLARRPARPNVILISIDTLRADHLGCYGHPGPITPNIDSLAEGSVRFSNVATSVPLTLPAHATMLTGLIPPIHGVHKNENYRLAESNVTLAELLQDRGYATGAVVSSFVLHNQFGLSQGFDSYDDAFPLSPKGAIHSQRQGEVTSMLASKWLDQHASGESFFLFVHFYDPHTDYDPPADFADPWPGDPYAGEVAYVDYCVGQVVKKLKDLDLYDQSLIVLTADHGEMLGEHGERTHGLFLYESAIKVPLIIKLPGREPVEPVVDEMAGLVDIAPTICSLLDMPGRANFSGIDLSGWIDGRGESDGERSIYCESVAAETYGANPLLGLVGRQWKYIETTRPELYDLIADPDEERNLIDAYPRRARTMGDELRALLGRAGAMAAESGAEMDAEARARLETLGYAGAGPGLDTVRIDPDRDDPKDLAAFHRDVERALELLPQGGIDEVIELVTPLVGERPDVYVTRRLLARALRMAERHEEALVHYDELVNAYPDDAAMVAQRAVAREAIGDLDGALADYDRAIGLFGDDVRPRYRRGVLHMKRGDSPAALADFTDVLDQFPEHIPALINRGTVREDLGDLTGAIEDWTEVIRLNPGVIEAWVLRANARRLSGDLDAALAELNECLKLIPPGATQPRRDIEGLIERFRGLQAAPAD